MAYAGFDKDRQTITFNYPLTVNSQVFGCNIATPIKPSYAFTNNSSAGMYLISSNVLGFTTNGLERLRIDNTSNISTSNCKIGINTPSPSTTFHINTQLSSNLPNILALPPITILEERVPAGNVSSITLPIQGLQPPKWITRPLSSVTVDGIGVNLSNNTFVLPIGTYYITAEAHAIGTVQHRTGLFDVTNSRYIAYGTSEYAGTQQGDDTMVSKPSNLSTVLTFITQRTLRLDHWITALNPRNANGIAGYYTFGRPTNISGVEEIYARVTIVKYQ